MPAGVIGPHLTCGHALALASYTGAIKARALRSRRVLLHADLHYYDPLGLPLSSTRLRHQLIRAVFADEAGQTGLPCSEPDRARVQLPVPRTDPPDGSALDPAAVAFSVTR